MGSLQVNVGELRQAHPTNWTGGWGSMNARVACRVNRVNRERSLLTADASHLCSTLGNADERKRHSLGQADGAIQCESRNFGSRAAHIAVDEGLRRRGRK